MIKQKKRNKKYYIKNKISRRFTLIDYIVPLPEKCSINFILIKPSTKKILVIVWKCRQLAKIIIYKKIYNLIFKTIKMTNLSLYFPMQRILICKYVPQLIYITSKYKIYIIYKSKSITTPMIIITKENSFLIKPLFVYKRITAITNMLLIIIWKYRAVGLKYKKACDIIYHVIFIYPSGATMSEFFVKKYLGIFYLAKIHNRLHKITIPFLLKKERTNVEYQTVLGNNGELFPYIKSHLLRHTLKIAHLISGLRISFFLFQTYKKLPIRKDLIFRRISNEQKNNKYETIKQFFKQAYKIGCNLLESEYYMDYYNITHMALQLYFEKIPTSLDLLLIDETYYYKMQDSMPILKRDKIISMAPSKQSLSNTVKNSGYHLEDIDFTFNFKGDEYET